MESLIDFLRARLDEDEAIARAAAGDTDGQWTRPCWHAEDPDEDLPPLDEDTCCVIEGDGIMIYNEGGHDAEQAEHIARHDPARVLADITAKRHIVNRYERACNQAHHDDPDLRDTWDEIASTLEGVVRHIATVYADHPDYQASWNP